MKKINLILIFLFMTSGTIMAQTKDSPSAKKVVEKGTKGDIVLGKENKKKQLNDSLKLLKKQDPIQQSTYVPPKKKKAKTKIGKNNN